MNAVLSVDKVTALVLVCARPAKRGKRTVAEWAAVMGCESDHVRAACAGLGVECDHADRPRLREASGIEVADHAARRSVQLVSPSDSAIRASPLMRSPRGGASPGCGR